MIEKAFLAFVGVIVISTAAAVGVVAAAYALFEALRAPLGAAGASGVVAAAIFLLIAAGAGLMALSRRKPPPPADTSLSAKVLQLARDKPVLAVGALVAAGVIVARNPRLVATAVSAFMAGQSARKG